MLPPPPPSIKEVAALQRQQIYPSIALTDGGGGAGLTVLQLNQDIFFRAVAHPACNI